MQQHIPIYHQQSRLDRLARNKDLRLSIDHECEAVRKFVIIDWQGNCFVCPCEAWLPVSVGNILDFDSLDQIWNNDISREIQQDLDQKKYSWCAVDMCGIRNHDIRFDRYTISINIDPSCNLRCPSCRSDSIMITQGPEFEQKLSYIQHLLRLLEQFDKPCHIIMSGNGDVLASHIMRPIIHEFHPKANQTFRLFTNGLLLRKQLEKSDILPQITQYQISIDAGSADVYERVRLGGKWHNLMENLDFLKPIADQYQAEVWLMLVVQKDNWKDIGNFADLAVRYGWTGNITKLVDWGTWHNFDEQDVLGNQQHADHLQAKELLARLRDRNLPGIHLDPALMSLIS